MDVGWLEGSSGLSWSRSHARESAGFQRIQKSLSSNNRNDWNHEPMYFILQQAGSGMFLRVLNGVEGQKQKHSRVFSILGPVWNTFAIIPLAIWPNSESRTKEIIFYLFSKRSCLTVWQRSLDMGEERNWSY